MTKFDELYLDMVREIMTKGILEKNLRTGQKTKALPGMHFSIDLEKDGFPLLTLRKIPIKLFVAEQIWFLAGCRKPEDFLREYTKIWDVFTNPQEVVTVAYGYRWRRHFGRDQIKQLVEMLKKDRSSRHGVVIAWDPSQDGLSSKISRKNVPCPYTFTANIIGGRLHLHNIVRSNDVILGAPADIAGFALLQTILAKEVGCKPGIYSHSISNAHIYEPHFFAAKILLNRQNRHKKIILKLPSSALKKAEKKDVNFANQIIKQLEDQYTPMDHIKGIKIAL